MKRNKALGILFFSFLVLVTFVLSNMANPHTEPPPAELSPPAQQAHTPYPMKLGNLPGITWTDDIHPIFIRNGCGDCHTRGYEMTVDVLQEFALGMIDPKDLENPFYSYHELVYAEGPPQIKQGETLRDGQCCWPKDYPPHKQRRIWLGHAERSVIVRKLERDYYDWDKPPRFPAEALGLLWGPPMPWYEKEGHHHEAGNEGQIHMLKVRSFFERALLHLSLWVGRGQDQVHTLPPRIPARDRDMLRFWINHSFQVKQEGTGIKVHVFDANNRSINDATVHLVGNLNYMTMQQVSDRISLKVGVDGKVLLSFPRHSVITAFWFVAAEKDGFMTEYQTLKVTDGTLQKMSIAVPQK